MSTYWNWRFTEDPGHHSRQNRDLSLDFLLAAQQHSEFVKAFYESENILEVGCGTGEMTAMLHRLMGRNVLGTDLSEEAIAFARSRHPGVKFRQLNLLTDSAGSFDLIIASNVLEHFRQPEVVIDRLFTMAPRLMFLVPYNQFVEDEYEEEGGAGHVSRFLPESFPHVEGWFTFKSDGWSCENCPYQLAVLLHR